MPEIPRPDSSYLQCTEVVGRYRWNEWWMECRLRLVCWRDTTLFTCLPPVPYPTTRLSRALQVDSYLPSYLSLSKMEHISRKTTACLPICPYPSTSTYPSPSIVQTGLITWLMVDVDWWQIDYTSVSPVQDNQSFSCLLLRKVGMEWLSACQGIV